MRTLFIFILALLVLGGAWYWYATDTSAPTPGNDIDISVNPPTSSPSMNSGTTTNATSTNARAFTVTGANFSFQPQTMSVKRGDTVTITFNNATGTHDLVIDEFDVRTDVLQSGESETISFVANQTGSFEYYCSVGNHREMGMRGTLIVTP